MAGRVLVGISGGIAAYKAILVVRLLRAAGYQVRCALTRSANAFVTPLTLEVLTTEPVYQQEWMTPNGSGDELHITAASWADVIVVVPATANVIGRLALGLSDDFLTTTIMAFAGPVVLAPAMHDQMWHQPAVQANVATLRERGVDIVGPEEGPLASGEIGMGRLADPETVVARVVASVSGGWSREHETSSVEPMLTGRKVVISAGPTHEPIDPVRFLGNRSSGKMGFALAAEAYRLGAKVVLVAGPVALDTPAGVERIDVVTALEMQAAMHAHVVDADVVVMAAAVADFRPREAAVSKLKKQHGTPELTLERNPDILAGLATLAPHAVRVGFAAETAPTPAEAHRKMTAKQVDLLVVNDVSRRDIGFEVDHNEVSVYRAQGSTVELTRRPKTEIARGVIDLVVEELSRVEAAAPVSG
ncbi:MAG: bifunctional phosphopantothenoylcysteine decarboxylase/phosphopantothenate--cysteine ligase CoaBC [Acidobacteriota bacterium]